MGENTYALVKGGNLHLYLLSTEKLIWERKEGLSNPSAVVIVDPLKDADHFHFNMHVLAVSRSGVLYSIPLQDMGASVKVISDFSAEIPKVTGGVPVLLHHFEHIALKDEVAYITSTYDNNGKKLFCTTKVNLKTNELTGFETFPDALAVSPTHSISNQLEVFGEKLEEMYFYVVDEKSGDVKGFKVVGDKAEPAWTVKLRHPIVSHAKGTHERSHFVNSLHVFPNRTGEEPVEEVRHRYPTHNVIALTHYEVLEGELPALVVTAIDAITGSVLGTVRHKSVEGDVRIVVVENNIVYYFMDAEKMRYLIGVWELFEEETGGIVRKSTGASPPQVIASFFSNNDRTYSSKTLKPPVIVPSTLGVQGGPLAAMGVTTSVNGIARKNIVLVFESGRVALVELRFLLSGGQMPFPTDKDRQITHVIIPSILLASHRYRLASPTGVVSEPTHLESSCHLVVSGLDLFYVRASSGKPFDLLNPDFNKSLLISLVCGFAFLSFVARYFVTRAKVNSKWK
ncbi:hypothetical protein AGDE_03616 [Angomonas deanei]|uniref:ER membrane protein complex subunit 1 n=1 Tax=Angomonas deanei TaxID=59799 RepID=A0A7G2C7J3_9TRYP|nr:hypothetical protein AGDE_03616 [Angomonas deanei]CAD2214777.1 ER membrane protein complex subunit 1, C-terminal, putative [Angomonas deanei]|eukprot:EPY40312.1 hypothetical protein AGDE_03616 [Angomonas deanei]